MLNISNGYVLSSVRRRGKPQQCALRASSPPSLVCIGQVQTVKNVHPCSVWTPGPTRQATVSLFVHFQWYHLHPNRQSVKGDEELRVQNIQDARRSAYSRHRAVVAHRKTAKADLVLLSMKTQKNVDAHRILTHLPINILTCMCTPLSFRCRCCI